MCRVEDSAWPTFQHESHPVARIPHRCTECRRQILPKEIYRRTVSVFDGEMCTYKTCLQCVRAQQWLVHQCNGWVYTETLDELVEHWHEGFQSLPFGRLIAYMKRGWLNGRVAPDDVAALVASAEAATRSLLAG